MDIVMITRDRPELTEQTIRSMRENAADWSRHRLVVVFDGTNEEAAAYEPWPTLCHVGSGIVTGKQIGVGGAKNYGADWLKHAHRLVRNRKNGELVFSPGEAERLLLMFSDNDMYYLPGWDDRLSIGALDSGLSQRVIQLGGWKHPFHQHGRRTQTGLQDVYEVDAVTGNCFVMRWSDWLKYGPFDSNAIGPGQSEDFALSQKIKAGGGLVATLDPPVAIHCGLVNSSGEPAVGWREMAEMARGQLLAMSESERRKVKLEVPQWPGNVEVMETLAGIGPADDPNPTTFAKRRSELPTSDGPVIHTAHMTEVAEFNPTPEDMLAMAALWPESGAGQAYQQSAGRYAARLNDAAVEMGLMHPDPDYVLPAEADSGTDLEPGDGLPTDNSWGSPTAAPMPGTTTHFLQGRKYIGVNVGSGQRRFNPAGTVFDSNSVTWWNVDSQSVGPDRIPDIICNVGVDPLPFDDGVAQYVVLHQVLEHFGCGESAPMLRECWRVLAPGGSLIVTVPDMRALAGRWLGGELSTQVYMTNVYGAYMGDEADRHAWGGDRESWTGFLVDLFASQQCTEGHACGARYCTQVVPFNWRAIPGADIARDWWILGIEVVKPS